MCKDLEEIVGSSWKDQDAHFKDIDIDEIICDLYCEKLSRCAQTAKHTAAKDNMVIATLGTSPSAIYFRPNLKVISCSVTLSKQVPFPAVRGLVNAAVALVGQN